MAWPLASQFSAMLQAPKVAFRDPELKGYSVERDQFRQPRPWAGSFAVVYKGIDPDGVRPRAFRVFTTESPERHDRYDAISEYLKTLRLNCLVEFEYREDSVRASGFDRWFPLILMEWVQGETLFRWVRARCKDRDAAALTAVATQWREVVAELEEARVAHGDFQHANIMVTTEGRLKLVDYDGMCVPALVGRRNLEVGVEPYQHPDRDERTKLSLTSDRFSALFIYTALRALAADTALWQKYVEGTSHDKLLFRKEDFDAPKKSPLFADLEKSPDDEVADLAEHLLRLAKGPMDAVPPLKELAGPSFRKIEQLLTSRQWDAAVDVLNRRGHFLDAPAQLQPLIQQAYEYVCRKEAFEAFCRVPRQPSEKGDRDLIKAWNEPVFAGFPPAEHQRPRLAKARKRLAVLEHIDRLVTLAAEGIRRSGEAAIVEVAGQVPEDYEYRLRPRVEQAARCLAALQQIENSMEGTGEETVIAAAWNELADLHRQELIGPELHPRIALARRRAALLTALAGLRDDLPPNLRDRRLLEIWDDELLAECEEAEPWRMAWQWAVYRRDLSARIEGSIREQNEAEIARLMEDPCLTDYPMPPAWAGIVRMARERSAQVESLLAAVRDGNREDFLAALDVRLVRQYQDRFAPYQATVCQWVQAAIQETDQLGLAPAVGRSSLVRVEESRRAYRVRWTWPPTRFAEDCLLAICPGPPEPIDDPRELPTLELLPINRKSWESGGGSRVIDTRADWAGVCVAVWAMIDLGFQVLPSRPLALGNLEGKRNGALLAWKKWRLFASRRGQPASSNAGPASPVRGEG